MIIKSFACAFRGVAAAVLSGRNLKIMLFCFAIVIATGVLLGLSTFEWAIVLLCCGGVIALEIINSAIEQVINLITREYSPIARTAKDMAAGAVLFFSLAAAAVGLIIFVPRILELF